MRKILSILTVSLLLGLTAWSQNRKVSGIVKDQTGEPVPFVTVNVKGTKISVAGNATGSFTITANTGDVLVVSAVGFTKLEMSVTADDIISPVLQRSTANTNVDVVVTTSFGIQRQAKSLGYSTTKISSKDLIQAKPVNVQNGLTGKVAGLQINTVNNGVGAPTRIILRGNRSITGNNQALIIVDGAIFYNDLSTLNPEDIADITTLKGASAATLYGSDASNGVLVITTKKGSRGNTTINFASTTQFETVSYMPSLQNRFGSGSAENIDFNDYSAYTPIENQSYGPEYNSNITVPLGRPLSDGTLQLIPYAGLPNEKRNFFDMGITTQNQVSLNSGDNNGSFLLSYQNVNTKGIMPKDVLQRNTIRFAGRRNMNKFTADYSVAYTNQNVNTTSTDAVYNNVYQTPAHVPLTSYSDITKPFSSINDYYNDYYQNPYWSIENDRNKTTVNSLQGSASIGFQPLKWLSFNYRLAATYSGTNFTNTIAEQIHTDYAKTNTTVIFANEDGTGFDTVPFGVRAISVNQNASYLNIKNTNFLWTSDFTTTVDKDIANKVNLKFIAGTSFIDNTLTSSSVGADALNFNVYNVDSRIGLPSVGESSAQARRFGIFGDATIAYDNKIFINGSYRVDLDSRLSKENRWIPYYGASASFVLTDIIPSIQSDNVLNFAKIRAAYSVTGNASALGNGSKFIANGAYRNSLTYVPGTGFPFGSTIGFVPTTLIPNPGIKPEIITEIELGYELSFMNSRLNVNGAVYQSTTSDGIIFASISTGTGGSRALVNAAETRNRGFEIDVNYTLLSKKDLAWRVGANWSHIESKVLEINADTKEIQTGGSNGNSFAIVGEPYPSIKSSDWIRDSISGKIIVDPIDGRPDLATDFVSLGSAVPIDIIGLTTSLKWKSFSLSAVAEYRGGHKIFNVLAATMDFSGVSSATVVNGRQPFVLPNSVVLKDGKYVENTNTSTDVGNADWWAFYYNNAGSNYVTSAAFWKLREVSLSYDLPTSWFANTKIIKSASFTVSGRNLLMLRPKTNLWTDPEFSDGTDNSVGRTSLAQAPPTRIFGATISVNF